MGIHTRLSTTISKYCPARHGARPQAPSTVGDYSRFRVILLFLIFVHLKQRQCEQDTLSILACFDGHLLDDPFDAPNLPLQPSNVIFSAVRETRLLEWTFVNDILSKFPSERSASTEV